MLFPSFKLASCYVVETPGCFTQLFLRYAENLRNRKRLLLKAWCFIERYIYFVCIFYKTVCKIIMPKKTLLLHAVLLSLQKIIQLTYLKHLFTISLHSGLEMEFLAFNDSALKEEILFLFFKLN